MVPSAKASLCRHIYTGFIDATFRADLCLQRTGPCPTFPLPYGDIRITTVVWPFRGSSLRTGLLRRFWCITLVYLFFSPAASGITTSYRVAASNAPCPAAVSAGGRILFHALLTEPGNDARLPRTLARTSRWFNIPAYRFSPATVLDAGLLPCGERFFWRFGRRRGGPMTLACMYLPDWRQALLPSADNTACCQPAPNTPSNCCWFLAVYNPTLFIQRT